MYHNLFIHSSVQFSYSVVSDSLRPHGLQHAKPPCLSPTPGVYSNSCPLSRWCHSIISFSVVPFSSCLQSFPASGSFPMSQFFVSGGQTIWVSATTSVLPMSVQNRFPWGLTCCISLQSKGPSVRKMVTIPLYERQQKRHRCIERSFGLCGRGWGWDDLGEWHWNMYLSYVKWIACPGLMHDTGCLGWCTRMTQRDGIRREVGGGFRMGNMCTPVADLCWYMAKPIQYCKVISLQLK